MATKRTTPPAKTPPAKAPSGKAPSGKAPAERPNARQQARLRAEQQQRRRRILMFGLAGLAVAVVAISIFTVISIKRVKDTNAADTASQQVGIPVPDEGRTHVPDGTVIQYKSIPPASGTHSPSPTNAGFYTNP